MDNQTTDQLLEKYLSGKCSSEEQLRVEKWLDQSEIKDNAWSSMTEVHRAQYVSNVRGRLIGSTLQTSTSFRLSRTYIAAAACVLLTLTAGIIFYLGRTSIYIDARSMYTNDIAPGKNSATLILADGTKMILSDVASGEVTEQAGIVISKTNDGQLIYSVKEGKSLGSNKFNTLSTANGEQYQVRLPDGSAVWLNAATSLTYPASFNGLKERRVELSGEAYFEVAKDRAHPFIVKTVDQEVQVLGTHFNLTAYPDEKLTKTTLLEGKVKVINEKQNNKETILKPGQQMELSQSGGQLIANPDLEEIIAWKEGYFKFSESLESIMNKVARWYNVEIVYQDNFNGKLQFVGKISRTKNLSAILDIIESASNIHFKIEGRRVIVMK